MAQPASSTQSLVRSLKRLKLRESTCCQHQIQRTYATHAELPATQSPPFKAPHLSLSSHKPPPNRFQNDAIVTLYSWPSMQPTSFETYDHDHLGLPLRRDLLHRAVVWEGDLTRRGTASTKHRTEVRGSSHKVRPQKGTGHARLSDNRAPHIRGGGVVHGPKPRDFGTELPAKLYDLAYRTALSYRYSRGELIVLQNGIRLAPEQGPRWLDTFFRTHGWGQGKGRTLLVAARSKKEPNIDPAKQYAMELMRQVPEHGSMQWERDVDVKDVLSSGRIIVEAQALRSLLSGHSRQNFLDSRAVTSMAMNPRADS